MRFLIMGIIILTGALSAADLRVSEIRCDEGYIQTCYGQIYYKKLYTDKNKDNTPLLVLHGGSGLTHDSVDTVSVLASEFPIIFYDQTGAGKSANYDRSQVTWDVNFFLKDLENVVEYFKLESIYLLGYSWGGALALEYALKPGNLVKKLILASPFLSAEIWTKDSFALLEELGLELKELVLKHIQEGTTDAKEYRDAMDLFNKRYMYRLPEWTKSMKYTMECMNVEVHNAMFGDKDFIITGNMKNYDRFQDVQFIKLPLLVTCGRYDLSRPDSLARAIIAMKNAELSIFEESAHLPHIEESELYMETIRNFLNRKNS